MPDIKHHATLIRQLIENHANNIHGLQDDKANELGIHVSTPKALTKPVAADKSNVLTLPYRK